MLTKLIGTGTVITLTATAQSFNATTYITGDLHGIPNQVLPALKVRIATGSQPAFIAFGNTATSVDSVLMPANYAEHFKLDSTNVVSVLQAGTGGIISITPIA